MNSGFPFFKDPDPRRHTKTTIIKLWTTTENADPDLVLPSFEQYGPVFSIPYPKHSPHYLFIVSMSEVDAPPAEKTVKAEVEEKPSPMATEEQSVAATITEEPTSTTENAAAATTTAAATPAVSENTPSWDHSDRRVMLQGVYKYHDTKQCRKLVEDMIETIKTTQGTTLEIHKTKKAPKQSWVSVTFSQVEMVQPFIDYVNNNDLKSRNGIKLFAKRAASNERKRRGEDSSDRDGKRQKLKAAKAEARRPVTEEEIKDRMCPLWRLSEEEQRSQKLKNMIKKCSMKIIQEIKGKFRNIEKEQKRKVPFYDWIAQKRSIVVDEVVPVPSPVRNKVEFTFGYRYIFDETTGDQPLSDAEPPKVPAVGFMILGWAGGVSKPHCCPTIGPEFCAVSDLVDTFLKDSPLLPYDSIEHKGFWRFLTIRASRRTRECMVTFVHSPACGGRGETVDFSDDVVKEKARLVALLKDAKLPVPDQEPIEITSISFQEYEGLSAPKPDDPAELAYGKPTLEERLGKCTFHISPGAFFQVNTPGAEILYGYVVEKVREVSSDPQNTLLFDVCCGTVSRDVVAHRGT